MKKFKKKIKKYLSQRLPESVKYFIRKILKFVKPVGNTKIPIEELKIFELLKDEMSVVFDVGAREDLSFYKIKNNCSYHLFEPSTESITSLKKQIALLDNPDIIVNEFGLSDRKENDCIYYEESQSFTINPYVKSVNTGKRYSLRTLDEYIVEHNIIHIDFLKIDAEGLDYRIIMGGLEAVKTKVSFIQFEYWDGVKKFVDLLGDTFNLYLMMVPGLLEVILEDATEHMTKSQKQKDYIKSVISLDKDIVDLIDRILIPMGCGGNILGISKNTNKIDVSKITFDVDQK
ncbi:hypothetical protein A3B84_01360 [Candidatus Nomurabacteria bacterium RIFCSPHIGHO2_02_FULL_35_13]|uniref:Methyltransferase FkbM domain-containing protein n=1 Tax=Candidatus Nomurabacteria bacterium RIFCSPHIGHO2_02_FULL_35_13 TaxID=1801748 RepID=A0A1F6VPK8_9BACT|nr:MAG: hypothetical protein UT00_C0018G0007 [Parcubacteria group bacterium GW2011_GWA1_38_7]OGI71509.1 MAG: hypothetical protein A3B84_01360 [Candidatus Nomurabacteria bacterium RIFCSPHIGHO2_02_FULL_35_13]